MYDRIAFDSFLVLFITSAIWYDLTINRIPNWLVFAGMLMGLSFNAVVSMQNLTYSVLGLVAAVAVFIIPFSMGWMGAGDVKFFGAVGAILGVNWVPRLFFYTALSGLVLAVVFIVWRRVSIKTLKNGWRDFKTMILIHGHSPPASISERAAKGALVVPYGVAIGLGTLVAYYWDPSGEWAGF